MDKHTSWASFLAAWVLTLFGAWTLQDWATFIGILLGVGTYLTNRYYKRREDIRQQAIYEIKRQQLIQGANHEPTE
ncbi:MULTISPECIES: HP1 family phage holin [Yersinia]|uniref:Holin n=1 Tax=Yersinia entomophaga TaxID=935293 RepID=A0ABN4PUX4_YERET|nr:MULTISPECIES: HP1 family phage holin [Yersinia]ANI30001.1 hypothetical protein PL78_09235 [Yersinia entomophaga]MCW6623663.1 phage holin family protein [Yersinia ruckeri]